jgi:hypothetical protein
MQRSSGLPGSADAASDRVRLARVALGAALALPEVIRGDAGPDAQRVTADTTGMLIGVTAIAQADGRYSIDLRLIARLVPLLPLADAVRDRVRRAAARSGLDVLLGEINVEFSDLLTSPSTGDAIGHEASAAPAPEFAGHESSLPAAAALEAGKIVEAAGGPLPRPMPAEGRQ